MKEILRAFPRIMGIVNVNDDSFSGDGTLDVAEALRRAAAMVADGADLIDVGAESARTNRGPIPVQEEIDRLLPFVESFPAMCREVPPRDPWQIWPPLLSVNTWRPEVVEAALRCGGVDVVNDIGGLADDRNACLCAEHGAALVVMHTGGPPKEARTGDRYEDVVAEMESFFENRLALVRRSGLGEDCILIDPGIDFAKQREDNLRVYRELERFARFGLPVLLPVSRKTVVGEVLGIETPADRDAGTVACLVRGLVARADVFRVHRVRAAVDCVRMIAVLREESLYPPGFPPAASPEAVSAPSSSSRGG